VWLCVGKGRQGLPFLRSDRMDRGGVARRDARGESTSRMESCLSSSCSSDGMLGMPAWVAHA